MGAVLFDGVFFVADLRASNFLAACFCDAVFFVVCFCLDCLAVLLVDRAEFFAALLLVALVFAFLAG